MQGLTMTILQTSKKTILGLTLLAGVSSVALLSGQTLCPIAAITGLPCPSCGLTRASFSLLQGDFHQAFDFHPLVFVLPLVFFVFLFWAHPLRKQYEKGVNRFFYAMIALFILVYIYRLIAYFPHQAPMEFNHHSLVAQRILPLFRP